MGILYGDREVPAKILEHLEKKAKAEAEKEETLLSQAANATSAAESRKRRASGRSTGHGKRQKRDAEASVEVEEEEREEQQGTKASGGSHVDFDRLVAEEIGTSAGEADAVARVAEVTAVEDTEDLDVPMSDVLGAAGSPSESEATSGNTAVRGPLGRDDGESSPRPVSQNRDTVLEEEEEEKFGASPSPLGGQGTPVIDIVDAACGVMQLGECLPSLSGVVHLSCIIDCVVSRNGRRG